MSSPTYSQFIFDDYNFDVASKTLSLKYRIDNTLSFTETYRFNFDFTEHSQEALDRAFQVLFFVAGVSYYKTYLPSQIVINKGQVSDSLAGFLSRTYQKGLGEFFYKNNLDVQTPVNFPANYPALPSLQVDEEGLLIGLGGGKDSLVSVEFLRSQPKIATWSLNHESQLEPLAQSVGLTHFWVERNWDKQLLELNKQGALNGHVPISAIFAAVGTIVAILSGYKDMVVSNESSASEPNIVIDGTPINHQYSKSLEFEKDFQNLLMQNFGQGLRYYSLLRPFSELRIAEFFASLGFQKYRGVFSSCNRAFTHDQSHISWCGECAKCAFTFLVLTPFVARAQLESLWGGKNLLLTPELEPTYRQLLGIEGDKPFDCVGEVKESRAAMRLAQQIYPELVKYQFDIPVSYDYRAWSDHSMPPEIFDILLKKTNQV